MFVNILVTNCVNKFKNLLFENYYLLTPFGNYKPCLILINGKASPAL